MRISGLIAAASLLAMSASANAADFLFTSSAFTVAFSLPDSPTPSIAPPGLGFGVPGSGLLNGAPTNFTQLTFLNINYFAGGFSFDGTATKLFYGAQVYSGPEATPTFIAGTYQLTRYATGTAGTLVISNVAGGVPEPTTWALMIGGFGLVGASMRRHSAKVSFA